MCQKDFTPPKKKKMGAVYMQTALNVSQLPN